MDFKQFQTLYNFRQRSQEELSLLSRDLQRDRSSSSSRSSRSSSRTSSSSRSSTSSSSSSLSTRSRSRSLPYSIRSHESSSSSSDSEDLVDELLEETFKRKRKRSRSVDRKKQRQSSRSPLMNRPTKYHNTVFVTQLSSRLTELQIEEFFSTVGVVSAVQLCFDSRSFQFQNAALVEFQNVECVLLALGLNGQKLKDTSIIVQPCQKHQIQKNEDETRVRIEFKLPKECNLNEIKDRLESHGPLFSIECKETKVIVTFANLFHAQRVVKTLNDANCNFEMTQL